MIRILQIAALFITVANVSPMMDNLLYPKAQKEIVDLFMTSEDQLIGKN